MDTRSPDFDASARARRGCELPPTLPSVLNVLVAGHRRERLDATRADLPAVREAIEAAIGHVGAAADAAFAGPPYGPEAARKIRIVTGAATGTDALTAGIVSSRAGGLSLKHVPPLTAHHAAAEEPPPGWLVEYAVATRDEEAVGHADVIVVVWDGGPPQGFLGGTVRIIQRAALASKPLLWIDTTGRCRLLDRTRLSAAVLLSLQTIETDPALLAGLFADCTWEELEREVREILAPDALFGPGRKRGGGVQLVGAYFTPRRRSWEARHAGSIDALLTAVVSLDFSRARKAARRLVMTVEEAPWIGPALPPEMPPLVALEKFFVWSDTEASIAAGRRRSSVWIIAICSFLAVFLSALGIAIGSAWPGGAFWIPIFEFVPLTATLMLFVVHRLQGVHQYWLFHRWLAEQLRFQRMVAPLDALHPALLRGVWSVPNTAEPPSPTGRHERLSKLKLHAQDWLLQRIVAAEDFNHADEKATAGMLVPWLDEAVESVMAGIADQERYHFGKASAFRHVHRNMDLLAVGAFAVTGLAVLGHLVFGLEWTIVLTTALPTAGAAMTGIADQLEAARISGQSGRAAIVLENYRLALEATSRRDTGGKSWREVWKLLEARRIAQDAVRLMALETDDWRAVLSHREMRLG
jgi:hypothetical protein